MGESGSRRPKLWGVALLLLVGTLVYACSSQTDPKGPSFPAGVSGNSDSGVVVSVAINPNAVTLNRRAGITILVANANGRPLEDRHVQVSIGGSGTPLARLDRVDGFTDADGKFVTFLLCIGAGDVTVTAFVLDGAGGGTPSGQGTVTCVEDPAAAAVATP